MGYQASFVTTEDPALFDVLVEIVRRAGAGHWEGKELSVPYLITMLQDTPYRTNLFTIGAPLVFPSGRRFIYFSGQHYYQSDDRLFEGLEAPPPFLLVYSELMPADEIFDLCNRDRASFERVWPEPGPE